jgi:hypothetical protein
VESPVAAEIDACIDQSGKFLPQSFSADTDHKINAIAAAEHFIRDDVGVRISPPERRNARI